MKEKETLFALIEEYLRKIEIINSNYNNQISNQYLDEIFEDYALATGSIKYAKLSGHISEEEAAVLKERITKATNNLKETDFVF